MQDIRIKNISKAYGDKQVLNHISKEFPSGETTVIMGASGCGKTTLLRQAKPEIDRKSVV